MKPQGVTYMSNITFIKIADIFQGKSHKVQNREESTNYETYRCIVSADEIKADGELDLGHLKEGTVPSSAQRVHQSDILVALKAKSYKVHLAGPVFEEFDIFASSNIAVIRILEPHRYPPHLIYAYLCNDPMKVNDKLLTGDFRLSLKKLKAIPIPKIKSSESANVAAAAVSASIKVTQLQISASILKHKRLLSEIANGFEEEMI